MKRTVLVIAAVLLAAGPAAALEPGLQEGHAAIGAMIPFGDFGDLADTGFLFGVGYGYWLSPKLQLGLQFDYHMYGTANEDVDGNIFSYTAFGKYALMMEDSTPYLKLLLGFYTFGVDDIELPDGSTIQIDSSTEFGFGAGLGYQYRGAGNIGFFGEAVLNWAFTSADEGVDVGDPDPGEVAFADDSTWLNLRAGISLYWGGTGGYARPRTGY